MSLVAEKARALAALDFDSNRLRGEVYGFTALTPKEEVREIRDTLIEMNGKITAIIDELTKEGQTFSKRFGTYPREYKLCLAKCEILLLGTKELAPTSPRPTNSVPAAIGDSIHLDEKQAEELKQMLDSLAGGTKKIWDITSVGKKTKDSVPLHHKKMVLQKPVLMDQKPLPVPQPVSFEKLNSLDVNTKDSVELNRRNMHLKGPVPTHRPEVPVGKKNNASPVSEKDDKTEEVIEKLPSPVPVVEKANAPVVSGNLAPEEKFLTRAYCPPLNPLAFVPATSSSTLRQAPILTEIKIHYKVPVGHTLFIRGSGAGLNWDFGVPLTKIDEDTYVYRLKGARGNLVYKILLDDTQWEQGEDRRIEQGKTEECTPDLVIPEVVAPIVEAPKLPKTTQIAVNFDVGFGNKLFIRGEGSHLSWEKGVEMQYKDEKWVYETSEEFDNSIAYKFLINDQIWEKGEDHKIAYGETEELTIKF